MRIFCSRKKHPITQTRVKVPMIWKICLVQMKKNFCFTSTNILDFLEQKGDLNLTDYKIVSVMRYIKAKDSGIPICRLSYYVFTRFPRLSREASDSRKVSRNVCITASGRKAR